MNITKIIADGKTESEYLKSVRDRGVQTDKEVTAVVAEIIEAVRTRGDAAVNEYTEKFDGKLPEYIEVPRDVINDALTEADEGYVNALLNAIQNITDYHSRQKEQSMIVPMDNGCILGQRVRGLARAGIYV
ncbi:MAG: histidinol dehydrogenase, partial [Ruminococcus sp.]|nr:histidinol dehydrogenase [Ruminococcus sp.]